MKKEKFLWKLTENYLNAIMVIVSVILIVNAVVYGDELSVDLAVIWILLIPFLGTFIDMRSNK
jgi:hypothetical protein